MTSPAAADASPCTEQQRRAIETQHVSVALSAGAGCGKTFVLTERFLSYFRPQGPLGPADLNQLVAITFTERAAREMRDRVRKRCYEFLAAAAAEDVDFWTELLRALDNARISTIHSFCGSLLRSQAAHSGLDPQFEVLEQAQSDTLLSGLIDDELRTLVCQQDAATMELAARFDLHVLRQMLTTLVREVGSDSGPWLARSADEQVVIWQKFHREQALPALLRQIAALPEARRLVAILSQHVPDHPVMRERRSVLLEKLPRLASVAATDVADALETIRAHAQVQRGGGAKAWDSADTYDAFKTAATKLRETIDKLKPLASFDAQAAREAAEIGQKLLIIATRIAERFDARKRELAVLDFDDLLRQARALLVDPRHAELRRQLAGQIRLLLVDEFQDTDRLQVELVTALAGVAERKLFFVGDYKQSIYRFRGADPDVFRRLRDQTPAEGRLDLDRNFRSQPAIVHFVNALFWHDLENYEPLRADRPQQAPEPAVEFLWAPATAEDNKSKELWRRREAEWLARRVRQILDDPRPIVGGRPSAEGSGEPRRARPGDIAILFRALSNVEYYEDALRRHAIDYYLVGGHAFYAQQEVFDLLNLLRALASPSDEVSLLGALRSGFFALTDETIFWLAQHPGGLLAGLSAADFPTQLVPEEKDRARFAAATLAKLRADKDRLPIYELIEEALAKTGYDAALVSEFMGDRKLANLRKLIEQARSFDRSGFLSLADFISQLSEFIARQPDEPLAATQGESMDAVRLMTIHQAKGLEFPIVIVPDLDRPRFTGSAGIHFDAELGPLVKLRDDGEMKPPASGYDLWRLLEKELDQAELTRLLYVATTRAADYLILASSVPELGSAKGPWTQLLARRFDLMSGMLAGDLPADEPRPKIKITSDEPPVKRSPTKQGTRLDWERALAALTAEPEDSKAFARLIDPIAPDFADRRRYSFSRLAGTLDRVHESSTAIETEGSSATDSRGLGSLVHAALAAIDLARPGDLRALVERHAERLLLAGSTEVREALQMIEVFIASPCAREVSQARRAYAEVEFLLAWPLDGQGDAQVVLGGFIDRLYQDRQGAWHVLDFKTNRTDAARLTASAAPYELQMLVYGLATEQILGQAPASLRLHFLRTGDEHAFAWNADARRRTIELVNQAIADDVARSRQSWLAAGTYRARQGVL